jgi:hypothetical protein
MVKLCVKRRNRPEYIGPSVPLKVDDPFFSSSIIIKPSKLDLYVLENKKNKNSSLISTVSF